ncbi:hypothetical protein [Modestobacter sp. Leaf380]|uniref:ArsA family ATPase n=1 Tax=Modestobacter sp. Leaf380 TaxID=1736356 RepID=UPI0006F95961|nr:hypothetical protein [Modestobacter sp. Leaf380]KQS66365.1 hypothetical protein ASG41_13775 [Modestobacter sp. Leaf380]
MRTLLVTGPGGAGSSTVAAATALAAVASGDRVVLLTTAPPRADLVGRVPVRVVDAQRALEHAWSAHATELAALVPVLTVPPGTSVVPVPGTTEVALLLALGELAEAGETDLVVVDPGPLPAATALLALPGALRWWLGQLAPARLRVLATVRALASRGRPGATEAALAAVTTLEVLLDRVPAEPAVHLVLPPVPGADAVLRTAGTALGLLGHRVASVTLSRVQPAGPGEWAAARTAQQEEVRTALEATGLPVRVVPETAVAPQHAADLVALEAAVPTTGGTALPRPAPVREGQQWLLAVPLPFAERGTVQLTRWDDDLVLDVGGRRRSSTLDPLLRRCTVTSGTLEDPGTAAATLVVRATPDPAQWPAGLLNPERSPA